MRMSVHEGDTGYSEHAFDFMAFCDGVELKKCHTADEEEGYAVCYDMDAFLPGMGSIPEKKVYGKIEIRKIG